MVLPSGIKALFRSEETFGTLEPQVLQKEFPNLLGAGREYSATLLSPDTQENPSKFTKRFVARAEPVTLRQSEHWHMPKN